MENYSECKELIIQKILTADEAGRHSEKLEKTFQVVKLKNMIDI